MGWMEGQRGLSQEISPSCCCDSGWFTSDPAGDQAEAEAEAGWCSLEPRVSGPDPKRWTTALSCAAKPKAVEGDQKTRPRRANYQSPPPRNDTYV